MFLRANLSMQSCAQVALVKPGRPKEVMIAISNYALVSTGMLPLWLKVLPYHLNPGP